MIDIKKTMLNQAISTLNKLGVEYLIKDGDEKYGNLVRNEPKKRAKPKYPMGEIANCIKTQLPTPMPESGFIDCKKYDPVVVRSSFSSHLSRVCGKEKYSTLIDKEKNCIWYFPYESAVKLLETKHG